MTTTDSRVTASPYAWLRPVAVTAALLLLGYGVLRLIGGLDGPRDRSAWPWMVGHTLFLFGIVAFGAVIVGLHSLLRATSPRLGVLDDVAAVAGLVGATAFVWVILGDLFPRFADAVATPDLVLLGGPALFELGVLTLLVRTAVARLLPAWAPILVLVGFGSIAVNLDLLPIGAALVLAGLVPLGRH
ncbi:hypothetical protein [Micromonospora narathiwatensis]|uniref:Low temperature requirement A protein (LtrA) n=1 Tax=Micromonospora narathiwatensis TaxID=299146 RepID=A0A1A9AFI0_9ACTN|nr:hypothetical protein [Micromonospora narathiwatensis]SBT54860.1 hypothetical protein GA0070621_5752 [Micromonospora narathiwatensis]